MPPSRRPGCSPVLVIATDPKDWLCRPAFLPRRYAVAIPFLPELAFLRLRLIQHRFGSTRWHLNSGVGPRVANHHLPKQLAQLFRLSRLLKPITINESLPELFRGRQMTRLEQRDPIVKGF